MTRKIIVILGPTASGKSALGVNLAKKFGGVVLSADSRQVYRGMDVGTAKITKQEMQGIPHYLLNIASPQRIFTVAQFQRHALRILKRIPVSTPIFVVGGSPFYIEAILNPLPFPAVKPNPKLRKQLERKTAMPLFAMLKRKDPRRAAGVDPKNKRRIVRALEIVSALGTVPPRRRASPFRILKLGIEHPRQELYRKIDARVDQRLPEILEEVRRLHRSGVSWKRLENFGLEYRWISRVLQGNITLREGLQHLKHDIHAFARRQMTWWRREREIRWITSARTAERLVRRFLDSPRILVIQSYGELNSHSQTRRQYHHGQTKP